MKTPSEMPNWNYAYIGRVKQVEQGSEEGIPSRIPTEYNDDDMVTTYNKSAAVGPGSGSRRNENAETTPHRLSSTAAYRYTYSLCIRKYRKNLTNNGSSYSYLQQ